MYINNNDGIGFKLFIMLVIFAGAIFIDLIIFAGFSDGGDKFLQFIESILYVDVDHTDCSVSLKHKLSLNERYVNRIYGIDRGEEINEILDTLDYTESEMDWEIIEHDYVIESCDTYLYYDKENNIIDYEDNLYDATPYKETLDSVIDNAIVNDKRPRLYTIDNNYSTTDLEPTYLRDEDEANIATYWANDPKVPSDSFFNVNGKYHFVIGNDVLLFDNLLGVGLYNGNKIQISDEVINILDDYV